MTDAAIGVDSLGFSAADKEKAAQAHPPKESSAGVLDAAFNRDQIHNLARESLDFLAALAVPAVFSFLFPPVFHAVWKWLLSYVHKERSFAQLALGLPRGFGKTTLIKIFILYCILFTEKKFILVISNTASLAENILSDIVDMLEESNIKKIFGDWKLGITKDTQAIKKFGFRGRNITLAALGAGTSLRGLNIKHERPDVMIFEDIQTREEAESEVQSKALETWMIGTAMKAKSPKGCMYIFVANMYPTKWSILRRLKSNPTWTKFISGGILAGFVSLWEELQPIEQLMAEFENDLAMGHPEIFYAEVLNDETASTNNTIDISRIPLYPYQDNDIPVGNFIIIDPATDKKGSDLVSIGYFEVHNAYPVLRYLVEDRLSPGDTIRKALELALLHNCRLIAVESNSYQYSLLYWFEVITNQLGIQGIECVDVYSGVLSKASRIITMCKSLLAGELYVHPSCRPAVNAQLTQFNPLKRDNTDGLLDLLTYASKVLEQFGEFVQSNTVMQEQEFGNIKIWDVCDTSSF